MNSKNLLGLVVLLVLSACGGSSLDSPTSQGAVDGSPDTTSSAQTVEVAIEPPAAQLVPGAKVAFNAAVTGTATPLVVWSVEEGAGEIDEEGHFTAPSAAGTCRVVATSVIDGAASAVATITVAPPDAPPHRLSPLTPASRPRAAW